MADLVLPHSIDNATTADATEVQGNFDAIETWVNAEPIRRDGSVAMTGQLNLVGDPGADNHATRKAWVEAQIGLFMPKGSILPYAGSAAPSGWLLCDGSVVSRTTYASLFAVVGTTYNTGGEAGTDFRLPNAKGRFLAGRDAGGATWADTLGERAGSKDAVVVSHTHTLNNHTHPIDHDHSQASTSSDGAHTHEPSQTTWDFSTIVGTVKSTEVQHVGGTNRWIVAGDGANIVGTTNSQGDHTHTLNLPNYTGSSGPNNSSSGAATGEVAGTDRNLPPYLTVNYIIRY